MAKWLTGGKTREFLLCFAASAALLFASLANFINRNDYPYVRGEVVLVAVGMVAISAAIALLYSGQRQWGRATIEGFLVALFLDFNANSLLFALGAGFAIGMLVWWRQISLAGPIAMLASFILVTTVIGLGGSSNWIQAKEGTQPRQSAATDGKPAVVHLVLDEHIGLEGLASEGAEGRRLRDELLAFFSSAGFTVYGRAYSRHFNTSSAIPEILNYGRKLAPITSKDHVEAGPTDHLRFLVDQGYVLSVIQSDFVNYCNEAEFHECVTYDSWSLRPTLAASLDLSSRAGLLAYKFVALSSMLTSATKGWNSFALKLRDVGLSLPLYIPNRGRSSSVAAIEAIDELTFRLQSIRPGEAIFAHLLLPHYPYTVRSDCSYLPWREWEDRTAVYGSTVQQRRHASYAQIRCTMRKLRSLLRTISQSPAGSNTVIIVHGDHGSRIGRRDPSERNLGKFRDADLLAGFSTLFAVRAPGVESRYFTEAQPVHVLLHDFAASGFRSAPSPKLPRTPVVFLADRNWKPVRAERLPEKWGNSK